MSKKKLFYFIVELYNSHTSQKYNDKILVQKIEQIINTHSEHFEDEKNYINKGGRVLNLTEEKDTLHTFLEIISENEDELFFRLTRQQPRNNYRGRNYLGDLSSKSLLSGNDENKNGIEVGTYAYFNKNSSILSIVMSKTAPNESAIEKIFRKFDNECYVKMIGIPNEHSVETLYSCENPGIKKLDIEVPHPSVDYLVKCLGWDLDKAVDILLQPEIKVSINISSKNRRGYIVRDSSNVKDFIHNVKSKISSRSYSKASMVGSENNSNLREYNFYDSNYTFNINIRDYKIENYNRISFSFKTIMEEYMKKMIKSYKDYEQYFQCFIDRMED